MEAHAAMTDEEDDVPVKGEHSNYIQTEMENDKKRMDGGDDGDDDDDDDVGMTEEEDDDDEEGAKPTGKSPSKGKKKAARTATDDEDGDDDDEDDDEEMKDDTADEDDDEDDDDLLLDEEDDDDDEKHERAVQNEAELAKIDVSDPKSMLRMIRSLPDEEARRHEHFRRSHFERGAIKRLMAKAIQDFSAADKKPPSVTQVMVIVMAGMTKAFVGELTAEARRIMEKNGETGPIEPRHLREAQRQYYKRRPLARGRNLRRLLR